MPEQRLYYVNFYYPPLARSQRVADCARALAACGFEVEVVTVANPQGWVNRFPRDPGTLAHEEHLSVTRLQVTPWKPLGEALFASGLHPCPHMNFSRAVEQYLTGALRERPGVVLSLYPPLACHLGSLRACQATGSRLVVDFRDEYYSLAARSYGGRLFKARALKLERAIVQHAALVATTTQTVKDNLVERHGVSPAKVEVIYNGLGGDLPVASAPDFSGPLNLIYAGALTRTQSPEILARAHEILRYRHPAKASDINVAFYGPPTRHAEKRLAPLLCPPAVTWEGLLPANRIPAAIAASHAGFLSLADDLHAYAMPTKLFEYMGHCRPVIAAVPGHGEAARLIRQLGVGRVTPAGDASALADLLAVIADSRRELADLAGNATAARERFTLGGQMKILAEAIRTNCFT